LKLQAAKTKKVFFLLLKAFLPSIGVHIFPVFPKKYLISRISAVY